MKTESQSLVSRGSRLHGGMDGACRPAPLSDPNGPIVEVNSQVAMRASLLDAGKPNSHHCVQAKWAERTALKQGRGPNDRVPCKHAIDREPTGVHLVEAADDVQHALRSSECTETEHSKPGVRGVEALPDVGLATSQRSTGLLHEKSVGELVVDVRNASLGEATVELVREDGLYPASQLLNHSRSPKPPCQSRDGQRALAALLLRDKADAHLSPRLRNRGPSTEFQMSARATKNSRGRARHKRPDQSSQPAALRAAALARRYRTSPQTRTSGASA